MIEHVKIFLVDGKKEELTVGSNGVKKIFFDRENPDVLVVLTDDNIIEYRGLSYVALKSYKKGE